VAPCIPVHPSAGRHAVRGAA